MSRRSLRSRVLTVACLAGVLSIGATGSARAVWFGAPNMSLPANVGFTCAGYPLYGLYLTGASSCTWFTIARFGELNALRSNVVPKGVGVITAFRIRTGLSTGPMRLTILKSLRAYANAGETACCIGDDQSPIVTPPANAITTYPLARPIPVYNGPESTTIESFDSIAVSTLDLRSKIPANLSGAYVTGAALFPLVAPGTERFQRPNTIDPFTGRLVLPSGPLTTMGYQVLLQANWAPRAGVTVPASSVRVRNGKAVIPLACGLDIRCPGILRLQNTKPKGATAARVTTYGSASFSIPAGKRRSIGVKLSSAGRKLMSARRSRQVWANVTLSLGSKTFTAARRITLRP